MLIYRVERRFCTRREDLKTLHLSKVDGKAIPNGGFELTPSWNKEPRSPYGWVGCDNSEETIEWMDLHGIAQGTFEHHDGNDSFYKRPTAYEDKHLMRAACRYYNVSGVEELHSKWQLPFYFGFETEDHFYKWFDEDDFDSLRSKGYYLALYEVCDNKVLRGRAQLMFERSAATQVGFILF